jgi:hypothetical protein
MSSRLYSTWSPAASTPISGHICMLQQPAATCSHTSELVWLFATLLVLLLQL